MPRKISIVALATVVGLAAAGVSSVGAVPRSWAARAFMSSA